MRTGEENKAADPWASWTAIWRECASSEMRPVEVLARLWRQLPELPCRMGLLARFSHHEGAPPGAEPRSQQRGDDLFPIPVTIPRMPFAEVVLRGGFNIPCPLTPWSPEVAGLAPALPNPMWMKEQCSWPMLPGLGPNVAVSVKVNVSALKCGYARKEAGLEQCEAVFLFGLLLSTGC